MSSPITPSEIVRVGSFTVARFGQLIIGYDGRDLRIVLLFDALHALPDAARIEIVKARRAERFAAWNQNNRTRRVELVRAYRARKKLAAAEAVS